MTTKKSSPTATKKPTPAKSATPAKKPTPTPRDADGVPIADILAVLKGIDAKLGALVPKPLEKL